MKNQGIIDKIHSSGALGAPGVVAAANSAHALGESIWLVGGAVRDAILGRACRDFDMAVTGDAMEIARLTAKAVGGTLVPLHDRPPTARVVKDGFEFDFASLRASDICADLAARDLTINALAVRLGPNGPEEWLDPTGGLADLSNKMVRAPARENLFDDPLRCLRVYRFAAEFRFNADPQTLDWTAEAAPGLAQVAGERILVELSGILDTSLAASAVCIAQRYGVLQAALPEMPASIHATARTLALMSLLDDWSADWSGLSKRTIEDIKRDPAASDAVMMKMAALFQADEAKEGASVEAAARRCEAACARLNASNRLARGASGLLRLRPHAEQCALAMRGPDRLRACAVYTGLAKELWLAAALYAYVLAFAERTPLFPLGGSCINDMCTIHRDVIAPADASPLIDGRTLMRELGIPPGPLVGRLLALLREEIIAGATTAEEALEFCRRHRNDPAE